MSIDIVNIVVVGASGRMGARISALALDDARVRVIKALAHGGSSRHGREIRSDSGASICVENADNVRGFGTLHAVIDFSHDRGVSASIALAREHRAALLMGTTALSDVSMNALKELSTIVPVIVAPNTSLGVCVLAELCAIATKMLGARFGVSIVEAHHDQKKDAPSGTALRLKRAVLDAGGVVKDDQVIAMRGGDVIGEHTVRFAGAGEYIELTHRATSRDLFARGAINAAVWLAGRRPGWYTIADVVNDRA